MGTLVQARCSGCGYQQGMLPLGAGARDFMERCWLPAPCPTCKQVVSIDATQPRASCPECGQEVAAYATSLSARTGLTWLLPSGEEVAVPEHGNQCPACGAASLDLLGVGFFD